MSYIQEHKNENVIYVKSWYFKNTCSNNLNAVCLEMVVHTEYGKVFKTDYVGMAYESTELGIFLFRVHTDKTWSFQCVHLK